jgi:hypothetical protein
MSALSTLKITRGKAMRLILSRLTYATDEQLQEWVNDIISDKLYNCWVVNNTDENDDELV